MYMDPFEERDGDRAEPAREPNARPDLRFNVTKLWGSVYRARYLIIACLVGGLALAFAITLLMKPTYRGTATVEVRLEAQRVLGTEDQTQGESQSDVDRFLATQLDIIKSRSTAVAVAEDLGLYNDPKFLDAMGVEIDADGLTARQLDDARRGAVIGTLMDNLNVELSKRTRIAVIDFDSPDPQVAAAIANSYAQNFIKLNLRRKSDASRYSLEFLKNQLAEAQARLGQSEQRALDYARRTRIIEAAGGSPGDNAPRSLTSATLVQLNNEAAAATARRIAAEQRWREVSQTPVMSIPDVLANPAIQGLLQQRAELRGQYEEQRERRQPDFPTVRQAARRITELDQQIATIAGNIRSTVRESYDVAVSQEQGIQTTLNTLKTATLNEQNQGIQLSILRREAQTNRQQFDALLNRYNQLNAESGVQLNNLSVVDAAEVPAVPVSPKLILNLALGLLLGIVTAAMVVLAREHLFDMVRTPDDVVGRLGIPVMGAVPPTENDVMADLLDAKSAVSEAFSAIRTSMSFASAKGFPRSLLVTSTQASEGKSTASFALSTSLAKLNKRIIIIDADLRRPNVHRLIGVPNGQGITEILAGETTIEAATIHDVRDNIDVITAGRIPTNPTDLLASKQFTNLIRELEQRYDHVMIDSAPVLGLADAPIVASQAERTLFVAESGRTRVRGAASALDRLTGTGGKVIGMVLSRFDPEALGYGSDYEYGAKYEYGS
jgi:capsular exopolysaccharide synthesis family protein